jgi:alkylation response protein AidB-like acyl-CoA dehydrogenase
VLHELTARTEAGTRLVALAETLAGDIVRDAAAHDRAGSFPFDSFSAVKTSGYLTAPVPVALGGLGVTSVHDVLVASTRLARGDAALTLGVNMHLVYVVNVVRRWEAARAAGDERRARAFAGSLEQVVRQGIVFAAATSEPGQDLTRPATVARRSGEGWIVSGRKVFCTMSPAADVFYTTVTFADDEGAGRYGYALVPRETSGVVVHDDWDALGMRASGSHSVSFDEVVLPASALPGGFRTGDAVGYMDRTLNAGLFHAAASLGVAEGAHSYVTGRLAASTSEPDARARMLAAENAVELSACRGALSRAALLIESQFEAYPSSNGPADELTRLYAEVQAAKAFVCEATVRIVDRALSLSGGAGYLNGSPLARAYRDVRAGAFMHPLGANRAFEFLGALELGREPSLH